MSKTTIDKIKQSSPFYEIIIDAYEAFAVPRPNNLNVCDACCMEIDDQLRMLSYQSSDIPIHYMREWYEAAAQRLLFPKNIWMFVLPRTLELLAINKDPTWIGIEVALRRFPTGDKSQWTSEQWDVLDRFQKLFLKSVFSIEGTRCQEYPLDDKLCMFYLGGWSLGELKKTNI